MEGRIRIAVANLQTGIGTTRGYWQYLTTGHRYFMAHGSPGIEGAVAFLRDAKVDVAAFCEIEGGSRRTREIDQVLRVSEESGLRHFEFFPTFVTGGRINMGNAICSRFPLQEATNHRLPGRGEPRYVSEALVCPPSGPFLMFVTHLSLEHRVRAPQIRHLAELMRDRKDPLALAGDFNVTGQAELALLSESDLKQVLSSPTFPSWRPTRHYDHLFFSEHFTVHESGAFGRFRFSDHLPLMAEVSLGYRGS